MVKTERYIVCEDQLGFLHLIGWNGKALRPVTKTEAANLHSQAAGALDNLQVMHAFIPDIRHVNWCNPNVYAIYTPEVR